MAGPYSGSFAFDSDEDVDMGAQPRRPPIDPAVAAAAASPPPPPPPSEPPAVPSAPPPLLYIRSERLAQLAARLPVNADRPALVHSLVEAYGLLEVRVLWVPRSINAACLQLCRGFGLAWLKCSACWVWRLAPHPHTSNAPSNTHVQGAAVEEAPPASAQQLLQFHSREYLQALAAWERLGERQRAAAGLQDDCAPFPG